MFNSIFSSEVTILQIMICSLCSLIFGVVIALTHRYTSKYSKNFLITITLLPFLVSMLMIMVNGNLGTSVAILGAFSLVRFRSLPGTSKEILSVVFSMTVGLACGMGSVFLGMFITIFGCLFLFLFTHFSLFEKSGSEKILKITIPENLNYTEIFQEEFEKYTKKVILEQVKTTNMGSLFDLSYRVILSKGINEKEFIDALRLKNGNLKILLSQPLEDNDL